MESTTWVFLKKYTIMWFGANLSLLMPLYATFWTVERTVQTTPLALKLPLVDENSYAEIYLNWILYFINIPLGALILTGLEISMNLFENFAVISPKLIHNEFVEMIDSYERKELTEQQLRNAFKTTVEHTLNNERYTFDEHCNCLLISIQ